MTEIDGITLRNVRCDRSTRHESVFTIRGDPRLKPRNLRFENVTVGEAEGELYDMKDAEGVAFEGVRIGVSAAPTSTVDRVLGELRNWDLATDAAWRTLPDRAAYDNHRRHLLARVRRAVGPLPARTPLNARVTGTVACDGYRVEKVMFESRPHYHVTGHLFLPAAGKPPYPAVLEVCGHSDNGKLSEKYQYAALACAKAGMAALLIDPVDQGERWQFGPAKKLILTRGHNFAGARAMLLGEEFVLWRAWDAMRAIDWLYTRGDIRRDGVGVMGNSGGGTMTSWMRVLDDRVRVSASSCYISTLRDVCASIGPQDAEQQIYGELRIGLNHAGMQLVRDCPGLLCCRWKDFFPFAGTQKTFGLMKEVARWIGRPDNWAMCDNEGPHGYMMTTMNGSVQWMRGHLLGERDALPLDVPALRRLGDAPVPDKGLNGRTDALVTPTGFVTDLPGEKTIYDLLSDKLAAAEAARRPLAGDALTVCVREKAGIRLPEGSSKPNLPLDLYQTSNPPNLQTSNPPILQTSNPPLLIIADRGRRDPEVLKRVAAAKAAGSVALVADVAGFGELGAMRHRFYGRERHEEGTAVMLYQLGESMVGRRATDILACAAYLKRLAGRPVTLVAARAAVIPAAHAYAADRALFGSLELTDRPKSWAEQLRGPDTVFYADCVYGGLLAYDWTELVK